MKSQLENIQELGEGLNKMHKHNIRARDYADSIKKKYDTISEILKIYINLTGDIVKFLHVKPDSIESKMVNTMVANVQKEIFEKLKEEDDE